MSNTGSIGRLKFDGPAVYRIRVQGRIRCSWCDRLAGMSVKEAEPGDVVPVTTLEGELPDQAGLRGVLHTLYELHLPVLTVECLDRPAGQVT